jgi:hypothetical protein
LTASTKKLVPSEGFSTSTSDALSWALNFTYIFDINTSRVYSLLLAHYIAHEAANTTSLATAISLGDQTSLLERVWNLPLDTKKPMGRLARTTYDVLVCSQSAWKFLILVGRLHVEMSSKVFLYRISRLGSSCFFRPKCSNVFGAQIAHTTRMTVLVLLLLACPTLNLLHRRELQWFDSG